MKKLLLSLVLSGLSIQNAIADQETYGVQVICDNETNTVKAQLISTMECGDGHCAGEDYEETAEGKVWLEKQVTWILPNRKTNTFSCQFDEAKIDVTVEPNYIDINAELAYINIIHNKLQVFKQRGMGPSFNGGAGQDNLITYKAFYLGSEKPENNIILGEGFTSGFTDNFCDYRASLGVPTLKTIPVAPILVGPAVEEVENGTYPECNNKKLYSSNTAIK